MTRDRDFKQIVRQRMAKTGESYTTARQQLQTPAASLRGWHITGPGDGRPDYRLEDYEGGLDPAVVRDGQPCAFLRSTVPAPRSHGVIMQSIRSEKYAGGRIRFSAWLKAAGPDPQHGGLWVRVVPQDRDSTLTHGQVHATHDWKLAAVVVDVPAGSSSIMFGLHLQGTGQVWFSGASFELVDATVPLSTERAEPEVPVNLTFRD
jgi:hypothetical protein